MILNNGHWDFPEQMDPSKYEGFVYIIRDDVLNKLYLGRKNYMKRSKLNPGESDWRRYFSSSNALKPQFKERKYEGFSFYCLEQYKTRSGLAYAETWSLCYVHAPCHPELWYNTRVEEIAWKIKEKPTERHIQRLDDVRHWRI